MPSGQCSVTLGPLAYSPVLCRTETTCLQASALAHWDHLPTGQCSVALEPLAYRPVLCRTGTTCLQASALSHWDHLPTGQCSISLVPLAYWHVLLHWTTCIQALVIPEKFQHILRVLNTNIDGRRNIMFALTSIKGIGRRYANIVCKKADVDLCKRAGELTDEEIERVMTIIQNPRQYKIPDWFLNRQKDIKDGKFTQVMSNALDNKLREDLERLKKIRTHRGLRHYWGLRVRGQHTKTTGHTGKTVGVSKKK